MNENKKNIEDVEYWFSELVDLDDKSRIKQLQVIQKQHLLSAKDLELLTELLALDNTTDVLEHINTLTTSFSGNSSDDPSHLGEGFQVGAYSIIKSIGHGGMGTVYLAKRSDGTFEQQVAIKVSNFNIDQVVQERFNNERKILAQLTHPNIAHLIDGGMTIDNQAYLIMEYVDGLSITKYCIENHLGLSHRIKLIQQVCDAVSLAHRQLILHRDLKPDNIFVNHDGHVKLLDFGIAKLIDEETALKTATQVMTKNYASPEQIQGLPASTQSDLFSLAVVAFELITGHHPFPSRNSLKREQNVISGKILKITQRNSQEVAVYPELADIVDSTIQGDLENILLKALSPEPDKRYETVNAFSQDLQNFLLNRPVLARKPSTAYSVYKWIQRHKSVAALAVITAVTLIGSTVFSFNKANQALEQQKIAEQQREVAEEQKKLAEVESEKSQQVADFLKSLFQKANPQNNEMQLTAQDLLMQGFEDIESQEFTSKEVKFELLNLIHDSLNSIGKYEESLSKISLHYQECIKVLSKEHDSCQMFLLTKARVQSDLTLREDALKTLNTALDITKSKIDSNPNLLFDFYTTKYTVLIELNRIDEAIKAQDLMIETLKKDSDPYRLVHTLHSSAVTLIKQKRFIEARNYIDQIPGYFSSFDENLLTGWQASYLMLEQYYYVNIREAKKSYEFSKQRVALMLDSYEVLPDRFGDVLHEAGQMAIRSGNEKEGLYYLTESFNFFKDKISGSEARQVEIKLRIILYYLMSNNLETAVEAFQKLNIIWDELKANDKIRQTYSIVKLYIDSLQNRVDPHFMKEACAEEIMTKSLRFANYCQIIKIVTVIMKRDFNEAGSLIDELERQLDIYPNDYLNFRNKANELRSEITSLNVDI